MELDYCLQKVNARVAEQVIRFDEIIRPGILGFDGN